MADVDHPSLIHCNLKLSHSGSDAPSYTMPACYGGYTINQQQVAVVQQSVNTGDS